MPNSRRIQVDIGGRVYQITSNDNYLEHIRNGFEPDMVQLFRAVASGSRSILDIGANIGCTALLFGGMADRVYAFEPSRITFDFLRTNVEASEHRNIYPQNFGLGAESGEFPLTVAPANRSGSYVSNHTNASAGHVVERIAIRETDQAVTSLGIDDIDFMKIDVEGFEGHVLRGAKRTLASQRPIVVAELNHWCLNAFQRTSIPDFLDQLRAIFPVLLAVDGMTYLNVHDESERYIIMYHHILQMRFPNLVGAFDQARLLPFEAAYRHGFEP